MLMVERAMRKRGAGFALCAPSPALLSLLGNAGFDRILDIYDTRRAALAAVAARIGRVRD